MKGIIASVQAKLTLVVIEKDHKFHVNEINLKKIPAPSTLFSQLSWMVIDIELRLPSASYTKEFFDSIE